MESDIANGDHDDYIRQMDRRLTVLETRFDTILPTLATKADLAQLEMRVITELHKSIAGVHKWLAAMAIAMLLGFGGMSLTMLSVINSLADRVEQAVLAQPRR
ncbi:hypothetical protein ACFSQU_05700 [Massilia sp. GCM10020059]|uniref:Uncharacterized protein n=1 Tax=Massilia agrisoli TaxID=2892444 RepID=A0ABS8J109_9BURK|nr:hypothetical protein [Massilia agrisoli]MCC6073210.1 hypothetical protein [Massilia agrisoli]